MDPAADIDPGPPPPEPDPGWAERQHQSATLRRRPALSPRRSAVAPLAATAVGAADLLALPALVHLGQSVQFAPHGAEAVVGLLVGVGVTGAVNSSSTSVGGGHLRSVVGGAVTASAGIAVLDVGTKLVGAPGFVTLGLGATAAVLAGGAAFVGAAGYPYFRGDEATDPAACAVRVRALRRVGVTSLVMGAAGTVALGVAAAAGLHPGDAGLIELLAIGATSASVVPLAGWQAQAWRSRRIAHRELA